MHTISVLYCAHPCMKCSLGISNFLEEISGLSQSIIFLYFFALITKEGCLISPCYSLELYIQMVISFLSSFAFRVSPTTPAASAICKASSDNHFAFLHFFFSFICISWRLITLQYCSGFCHTLMNQPWIYMYSPSWSLLPPPSLPDPSATSLTSGAGKTGQPLVKEWN